MSGRAAVLVDRGPADDRIDAIAVGQGPRQRLEDDDAGALAAHEAVGPASKAWQRPSGDSMPSRLKPTYQSGKSRALTPPASASGQPSSQMLWQARCTATSAEEQAVSTATLGPRKSKQ